MPNQQIAVYCDANDKWYGPSQIYTKSNFKNQQ